MAGEEVNKAFNRIQRDFKTIDQMSLTEAVDGFLGPARDDLKASLLLFDAKLYALSTYHLQQGTEKATKALLLSSNLISLEEVKSIGHNSLQGHDLLAQRILGYFRDFKEFGDKIALVLKNLDLLKKTNREKVARYSYEEIIAIVNVLDLTINTDTPFAEEVLKRTQNKDYLRSRAIEVGIGDSQLEEAIIKVAQFF
jgi:hypothetical protein